MKNIWLLQQIIMQRLLAWGFLSVVVGLVLLPINAFWRGFGTQAIGWGGIDAVIAIGGGWFLRRRRARLLNPNDPTQLTREAGNLRRLLWFNAFLDVFYVLGGLVLVLVRGAKDKAWSGHGWGIMVQAGFLFFFDLIHALLVPKEQS